MVSGPKGQTIAVIEGHRDRTKGEATGELRWHVSPRNKSTRKVALSNRFEGVTRRGKRFQIMIDGPVDKKYAVKIWDLGKDEPAYDGDWTHISHSAAVNFALRWLNNPKRNPRRRKNVNAEIFSIYARGRRAKFGASDDPMTLKRVRKKRR